VTAGVLVTRPAGSWPKLVARFEKASIPLRMAETAIQVAPLDPRPGAEALRDLSRYDWLVATSGKGVAALFSGLASAGIKSLPPALRVAAVGEATAAALARAGVGVELVAADPRSAGLAAELRPRLGAGVRVLLVRPEGGPDALASSLREAGGTIVEAPLYRTVPSPNASALADDAIAGAFHAVAFTAPSSFACWLDAARDRRRALIEALRRAARVAIGPTTAARLLAAGLAADRVAAAPTEDAVGDALEAVLRP
jgi:uroporphyrinogen-III synthase